MSCLITALTRSHTIKKTTGEKINYKLGKRKKKTLFTAKIHHLNLKTPSNNVKIQSEKNLTTKIYFFVDTKEMRLYIKETRLKVDKKKP